MNSPSTRYTSFSKSGKLNRGSNRSLPLEILSSANVISYISGLKVFDCHDALGDSCGVPPSSVDQPPSVLNCHWPFILLNDIRTHCNTSRTPLQTAPIHPTLLGDVFRAQTTYL
uniref:Uncharacterized protein n=1 Tax=Ailuropoda melanoleuca TaxID=9646 RepID=A0A7N5KLK3_AILME